MMVPSLPVEGGATAGAGACEGGAMAGAGAGAGEGAGGDGAGEFSLGGDCIILAAGGVDGGEEGVLPEAAPVKMSFWAPNKLTVR